MGAVSASERVRTWDPSSGDQGWSTVEPSQGLQTVERTLRVLDLFAADPEVTWSLAELTRELGMNKTTVFRILGTLEKHGYLTRDRESRRYTLGPAALALGSAAGGRLRQIAYPELRRLTEETGETSQLHVITGLEIVCVDKVESSQPVRVSYEIGRRGPLHAGASGKSLLAFLSDEELDEILPQLELRRYTENTVTDADQLRQDLESIRAAGYAQTCGEMDRGVCAVSVPIWNGFGRLEAALNLSGPMERWTPERTAFYIQATQEAAARISQALGYRPSARVGAAVEAAR